MSPACPQGTFVIRVGRGLAAEGVDVVRMGERAGESQACLERYGPRGLDLRLAGLCEARRGAVRPHALERPALGARPPRAPGRVEGLRFYICDVDVEDELDPVGSALAP